VLFYWLMSDSKTLVIGSMPKSSEMFQELTGTQMGRPDGRERDNKDSNEHLPRGPTKSYFALLRRICSFRAFRGSRVTTTRPPAAPPLEIGFNRDLHELQVHRVGSIESLSMPVTLMLPPSFVFSNLTTPRHIGSRIYYS